MPKLLAYCEKDTFIHRLTGVTKLVFFIAWSVVGMVSYDTRVLLFMLVFGLVLFALSKTEFAQVATVFKIILFFLSINILAIFALSPYEGCKIYASKTVLFHLFGNYSLTSQQLFYEMNVALKYLTIVPIALLFILTTNPSEFASSLNKVGFSYGISTSVALALRYIPDIQNDFIEIRRSQEARGLDMSKDAKFFQRVKSMAEIIFPLVFLSMDKINYISNAMELRGFGKHPKRSWYSSRLFSRMDYLVLGLTLVLSALAMIVTFSNGGRFYNPFLR